MYKTGPNPTPWCPTSDKVYTALYGAKIKAFKRITNPVTKKSTTELNRLDTDINFGSIWYTFSFCNIDDYI